MNDEEVSFDPMDEVPECPGYINVHGRQYWDRIVPVLQSKRVLTEADLESLEIMVLLYGKVRQAAQAGVELNASTITQLRLYQGEFGLTPVSRTRIKQSGDGVKENRFKKNSKARTN